eukprot:m.203738 g.203738  ORF g.203738 m.203738 type:complete len:1495 (+) comp17076_c0_seq1:370-4854(+)
MARGKQAQVREHRRLLKLYQAQQAIINDDINQLQDIITNGDLVNARDKPHGRTVIHIAAATGAMQCLQYLLELPGVDLSVVDAENGWTALHRAIYFCQIEAAVLLLKHKAPSYNTFDHNGFSPVALLTPDLDGLAGLPTSASLRNRGRVDESVTFSRAAASSEWRDLAKAMDRSEQAACKQKQQPIELARQVYAWGSNINFALGFSDGDSRRKPQHLAAFDGADVQATATAKFHTLFLLANGTVYACGHGRCGRLGTNKSGATSLSPHRVLLPDSRFVTMAAGRDHSLFVNAKGQVFACGNNQHGQLGLPDVGEAFQPVMLRTLKGKAVKHVAASNVHSVFLTNNALYSCGLSKGQLGHSNQQRDQAIAIVKEMAGSATLANSVTQLDASESMTAALLDTGVIHLWHNGRDRTISCPAESVLVGARSSFVQVVVGKHESLIGLSSTGAVWVFNGSLLLRVILDYPRSLSATSIAFGIQETVHYTLLLTDRFSSQTFEAKFTLRQLEQQTRVPAQSIPLLFQSTQVQCDPGAHHFLVTRRPQRVALQGHYAVCQPTTLDTGGIVPPDDPVLDVTRRLWGFCNAWLCAPEAELRSVSAKAEVAIRTTTMPLPQGLPADNVRFDLLLQTAPRLPSSETMVALPTSTATDSAYQVRLAAETTPASSVESTRDASTAADLDVTAAHAIVLIHRAPGIMAQWHCQHQDRDKTFSGPWHVQLPGLETASLRLCLEYVYTGRVDLRSFDSDAKMAVLKAAVFLRVLPLIIGLQADTFAFAAIIPDLKEQAVSLGYGDEADFPSTALELKSLALVELHPTQLLGSPRDGEVGASLLAASTDILLVVSGTELPCHSAIICQHSPVLGAWFDRTWQHQDASKRQLKLHLPVDVPLHSVQRLLTFAYAGRLTLSKVPFDELLDLLVLSAFYLVHSLATLTCQALAARLDLSNVAILLNYACFYTQTPLLHAAAHFACRNLEVLLCSKSLIALPSEAYAAMRDVLVRHLPVRTLAWPSIGTPAWLLSEHAASYQALDTKTPPHSPDSWAQDDRVRKSRRPVAASPDSAVEVDYVLTMTSMGFDAVASQRLLNRYGHSELGIRRATEVLMTHPDFDPQKPIQAQVAPLPTATTPSKKKNKRKKSKPPAKNLTSSFEHVSSSSVPSLEAMAASPELSASAESKLSSKERRKLRRQQEAQEASRQSVPSATIDVAAVAEFVPSSQLSTSLASTSPSAPPTKTQVKSTTTPSRTRPPQASSATAAVPVALGVQAVLRAPPSEPVPTMTPGGVPLSLAASRGVVPMMAEWTDPAMLPKRTFKPLAKPLSQRQRKAKERQEQADREARQAAEAATLAMDSIEQQQAREPNAQPAWGATAPVPQAASSGSQRTASLSLKDLELEARRLSQQERSFTARLQSSRTTPPPSLLGSSTSPKQGSWASPSKAVSMRGLVADMQRSQQQAARAQQRRKAKTVTAIQIEEGVLQALHELYATHDRSDEWIVIERRVPDEL